MLSLLLELNTVCSSCANPLPINGFTENIFCGKCNKENYIALDLWKSLLEEKIDEIKSFEEKEGRNEKVMTGSFNFDILYGRRVPRCSKCKTEIPEDEINKFTGNGKYNCKQCSSAIFIRCAPESLITIIPSAKYIVNEDEFILSGKPDTQTKPVSQKPILFNCPSCAGNLEIDGTSRLVVCKYCESNVYLPDDLWFTLHPVATKQQWFITVDSKIESQKLPKWERLSDVAIDREGNFYFAGTEESSGNAFIIFSASPDLKKRWETKELKLSYDNSHLAITKSGNLYVWDSTKHSMYVLSCSNGAVIKEIKGAPGTNDNPYSFTLNECNALISDSDETILALIKNTLIRFNQDGTRASLWYDSPAGEHQGFFSNLFKGDDAKINILENDEDSYKPLTETGDRPKNMESYSTKMFLGWDDYIYFYNTRSDEFTIAKYNRDGKKIWNKNIKINESGDKIYADGKGNVFIIGEDENEKSKLLRLSPDGNTIEVVLKDITEGGTLRFDSGDMLLVSYEGLIYSFNSYEQLRIFNPDFSVKYKSNCCKEDDEDLKS